jgi:uncharacterized protein with GYD domain
MQTYVLMTTLTPGCLDDAVDRRIRGRNWLEKVHRACPEVKWVAHYALLGRYDFMDIYQAPDDATAHKVSLITRGEGALMAESWPALDWERHLELLAEVSG